VGVPFYLRTGKRMAEGLRIISIAFKEAPRTMFPAGSGVISQGPDHLTFDLADASRLSLSFYGKRPGPGMRLEKLSMQFSTQETETAGDVLEAYERLILDAMRGDHTLFTTAESIESLWVRSEPLLADPPPVKIYPPGTWGLNAVHQLIAPNAWQTTPLRTGVAREEERNGPVAPAVVTALVRLGDDGRHRRGTWAAQWQ
jgi:glucose-6-phosphate 1-dehydrogenase